MYHLCQSFVLKSLSLGHDSEACQKRIEKNPLRKCFARNVSIFWRADERADPDLGVRRLTKGRGLGGQKLSSKSLLSL
jgi:hypothetical protein